MPSYQHTNASIPTGLTVAGDVTITGNATISGNATMSGNIIRAGANSDTFSMMEATTTVTPSANANTATATALIPAGSVVFGITERVLTAITGATSWRLGASGGANNSWGNALSVNVNTTNNLADFIATGPIFYGAATDVVMQSVGGNFTAGSVRLCVHYLKMVAPTS